LDIFQTRTLITTAADVDDDGNHDEHRKYDHRIQPSGRTQEHVSHRLALTGVHANAEIEASGRDLCHTAAGGESATRVHHVSIAIAIAMQ
jgi:hypothetical protein